MKAINYSIIIPHYNSPKLLIRCLASIPIREDIQVIVVDDCSPNSSEYLNEYPELNRLYLEYYSTPKGGSAGRARNIGLDKSKGKWVICMDADDLFVPNMEDILSEALNRTEDVLYYNYKTVMNNDLSIDGHRNYYQNYFTENKTNNNENDFRYYFDSMWGKIISNKLIQAHHIRCDETSCGNDVAFSFKCGAYAKSIAIIDKPFFIITEREGTLAASQFTLAKPSIEEYKTRLGVKMNLSRFVEKERIGIQYSTYLSYAFQFYRDWPTEFKFFLYKSLFKKYPRYSIRIILYIIYYSVFKKKNSL